MTIGFGSIFSPWSSVVGEDDELVFCSFVLYEVDALLHVRHDHPVAHCLDVHNKVGDVLQAMKDRGLTALTKTTVLLCFGSKNQLVDPYTRSR